MPAKPKAKPKARAKRKSRKSNAGAPTKMTQPVVAKLEKAFLMGCTDLEACLYAGISKQCLYNYQKRNPEYVDRKAMLKENPVMKSREVIMRSLEAEDDPEATLADKVVSAQTKLTTANKILDRKEGSKLALTGPGGGPIQAQTITSEMSPEEAGKIYADFFRND